MRVTEIVVTIGLIMRRFLTCDRPWEGFEDATGTQNILSPKNLWVTMAATCPGSQNIISYDKVGVGSCLLG